MAHVTLPWPSFTQVAVPFAVVVAIPMVVCWALSR